jgi:alpha-ketoglutarate-dependent taurine dioxygenase
MAPQRGRLAWKENRPFGIEIDFDLRQPLSETERGALRRLLFEHGLLILRGQSLTMEQQVEVSGYFGTVLRTSDGIDYVSNVEGKGGQGRIKLPFHSDLAFTSDPYQVISFLAVEVPGGRSSTKFANGAHTYRTLPDNLKARLEGLEATAVFPSDQTVRHLESEMPIPQWAPRFTRPAIMPHPVTGASILYVCEQQTARIEDLPMAESDALIKELFDYLYRPENVYEHRWYNGDFLIVDNLALQHARDDISDVGERTLQKVVVARKGFFELCPQFHPSQYRTQETEMLKGDVLPYRRSE